MKTILILGATGTQGGSVVHALLKTNHKLRGFTRNLGSPKAKELVQKKVELFQGDIFDRASLAKAMQGANVLYAVTTPFEKGLEAEILQGKTIIDLAVESGIEHLVFSSVASANLGTGIPHFDTKFEIEKELEKSGLNYTVIAPVFFMDNFLAPWFLPGLQKGKLMMALPSQRPLQQVAAVNIGEMVAAVIERGQKMYRRRIDIAGDSLSGVDAARIISELARLPVEYIEIPLSDIKKESEDMAIMYEWFDRVGYSVDMKALHKEFGEIKWLTFHDFALLQDWTSFMQKAA